MPVTLPIYWINLQARTDRRSRLLGQFNTLGITNHVRISAITDKQTTKAIALSHINAIATAWYDGASYAMICEDDIDFTPDSWQRCQHTLEHAKCQPFSWDILQLHYIEPTLLTELLTSPIDSIYIHGNFMSCACYIISRDGMRKFLEQVGAFDNDRFTDNLEFKEEDIMDMFLYRKTDTYVPLYPAINTFEVETDNNHNEGWQELVHNKNMIAIQEIFDKGLWHLPNAHGTVRLIDSWFLTPEKAKKCLENYCSSLESRPKLASFLHGGFGEKLFQLVAAINLSKAIGASHTILAATDSQFNKYLGVNKQVTTTPVKYNIEETVKAILPALCNIHYLRETPNTLYEANDYLPPSQITVAPYFNLMCGYYRHQVYINADPGYVHNLLGLNDMHEENSEVIICINIDPTTINTNFIDLDHYYSTAIAAAKDRGHHDFIIISSMSKEEIEGIYPSLGGIHVKSMNPLEAIKYASAAAGVIAANTEDSWWCAWACKGDFKTIPSKWRHDTNNILELDGAIVIPV